MNATPIRFLFDFISPYAWLAWTQVHALATRHGREVEPVPVLFAAMLDAWGHKGPAEIPPKREHLMRDVARHARRLAVPLSPPPAHPFNPLLALRVASLPMPEDARRKLIDALYDATWATGEGVETPERVATAADRAGLPGAELVERAAQQENKDRLRDATRAAIERGVFGVPTLDVDGELFWGTDGIDFAGAFLRGEDPVPKDLSYFDRAPSAVRPRSK